MMLVSIETARRRLNVPGHGHRRYPMTGIPYGYCHCGCGEKTRLAPYGHAARGWVAGEPLRFINNHHGKVCNRRERHGNWKGDDATPQTKRQRAARWFPDLGECACGAPAVERHHRDADPGNNDPANVAFVCRRCHMATDGRLARAAEYARMRAA